MIVSLRKCIIHKTLERFCRYVVILTWAFLNRSKRVLLVSFGLGQFGRSVLWCLVDLLIGYHLAIRVGLSGQFVGSLLLISFIIGGTCELLTAIWVSSRPASGTAALRLQAIAGAICAAAALVLLAPAPTSLSLTLMYVGTASLVFRIAYAVFDVCQNALTSLLPISDVEVSQYVLVRTIASSIGRLLASIATFGAIRAHADQFADVKAFATVVPLVLLGIVGLAVVGRQRVAEQDVAAATASKGCLPYRSLIRPVTAMICSVALLGLIGRLLPLVAVREADIADGAMLTFAMVCGTIIGPFFGTSRTARRAPRSSGQAAAALGIVSGSALLLPLGWITAVSFALLYGAAIAAISNVIWERVALVVTNHAVRSGGERVDLMAFAVLTASINVALAVSSGLLGLLLDGFRAHALWSTFCIFATLIAGGIGTAIALAMPAPLEDQRRSPKTGMFRRRNVEAERHQGNFENDAQSPPNRHFAERRPEASPVAHQNSRSHTPHRHCRCARYAQRRGNAPGARTCRARLP